MHCEIRYKDGEDSKALIDAVQFMGMNAFKTLARVIRSGQYSENQIRFFGGMAGVEGKPITIMIERYHG